MNNLHLNSNDNWSEVSIILSIHSRRYRTSELVYARIFTKVYKLNFSHL